MRRLNLQDASFLQVETNDCPMHIASIQVFDLPKRYHGKKGYFQDLMKRFKDTEVGSPFNLKLHSDFLSLDVWPSWEEDEDIDLDYHVRFVALPSPGSDAQLMRLVERLHVPPLDRTRPLWEVYFIDGLQNNRVAVYFKTHHAVIDGVAGMSLIQKSLSTKPSARGKLKPLWQPEIRKKTELPKVSFLGALRNTASGTLAQVNSLRQLTGSYVRREIKALSEGAGPSLGRSNAPKSPFNVPITRQRRLAIFSLPLSRSKEIAKDYGGTVNDLVLALCGSALRRYLEEKGTLPSKSLIASCPVSVRAQGADQSGNNISVMLAPLGTDIGDPVKRLAAINKASAEQKQILSKMSQEAAQNYGTIVGLTGLLPQLVGAGRLATPPANIVVSNVPGPRQPLYLGDAKLAGIYPVSIVLNYQALNITVLSRGDELDFGLIAAREAVPDLNKIADYMQEAFGELDNADDAMIEAQAAEIERRRARRRAAE